MSEARTDERLDRLEADVREIKTTLAGLAPIIHRIDATLPHLGTKAELAELRTDLQTEVGTLRTELAKKPGYGHAWMVMAALISSYTLALAGAALIIAWLQTQPPHPPPHASAAAATNIVLWSEP